MKRCNQDEEKQKIVCKKQCSTKSWADLDLDLLGEVKKKLYWGDHARFSVVCKTWLAAEHEKRAGDVLPWWLMMYHEDSEDWMITYHLYQPLNLDQPEITRSINLNDFFDSSTVHEATPLVYFDGCLCLSMYHIDFTRTHFLIVSILDNSSFTLPQFHHPNVRPDWNMNRLIAVSTCPASSDCVFLAIFVVNSSQWTVGIFRHGDAHWTTTQFDFQQPLFCPRGRDVVFIRGLFYFLCHGRRLASYDIASGDLNINSYSMPANCEGGEHNMRFFALDGELMLMYYDPKVRRDVLTTYDSSSKLWVPLKCLGDRSLFISRYSVYVDYMNYYRASPNKIYYQEHGTCYVYNVENGLLESTSSGLKNWDGLDYGASFSMWIEPPALLSKKIKVNITEYDIGMIERSSAN